MDNYTPSSIEIPTFKLAKVGKERNRRRGAGAWLRGGSSASGAGSLGSGIGVGTGMTKGMLTILISVGVSAGAWQYGKMMSSKYSNGSGKAAAPLFTPKEVAPKYADTSKVIKVENSIPNSLGYVTESIDGLTPEQRAQRAAATEAARQADEEARKKAEADANKPAETPASASPVDLAAMAGGAAPAGGIQSGKIGKLASGFGGGGSLSGGAGLSGGISRNFAGGSDLGQKAQNGALSSMRNSAKPSLASASRAITSNSKSKGFAKRQLDNAFSQSRQAVGAAKSETSATTAAAPFDNNPGAGSVIEGPGTTNGAKPAAGTAGGDASSPSSGGGPLGSGYTPACQSANYSPDANGNCQLVSAPTARKSAPYQNLVDMAKTLMAIIAVLALVAIVVEKTWAGAIVAQYLKVAIVTMGVVLMGLGAAIFAKSGDSMMGGIITAIGAATVASAYFGTKKLTGSDLVIKMAANTLITNAIGSLAASAASSSQLQ